MGLLMAPVADAVLGAALCAKAATGSAQANAMLNKIRFCKSG
jgi:hypothetical protein